VPVPPDLYDHWDCKTHEHERDELLKLLAVRRRTALSCGLRPPEATGPVVLHRVHGPSSASLGWRHMWAWVWWMPRPCRGSQAAAAEKRFRVTLLSGDVHVAGCGAQCTARPPGLRLAASCTADAARCLHVARCGACMCKALAQPTST
jgi:hypothetical protein